MKLSRLLVDIDVCQYAVWELSTFMLVVINCLHLCVYQRLVLLLHGFALTDVNLSCSCLFYRKQFDAYLQRSAGWYCPTFYGHSFINM